jgi:hypothetical protein
MNGRSLRLGEALGTGWRRMWRYPGPAIGGFALYVLMCVGVGWIPCLGSLADIAVVPPLVGGYMILAMKVVDDRDPKLGDLFAGFRAYWKWMGIHWLYTAIVLGALGALGVLGLIGYFVLWENAELLSAGAAIAVAGVIAFAAVAVIAVSVGVLVTWAFIYYAGVEAAGALDTFAISGELTRGRRLQLLWMWIALGLISGAGVLVLVLGVFVTAPLATLAGAALYRQVNPRPEVTAPEAPPVFGPIVPEGAGATPQEMPGGLASEVRDGDEPR